MRWILLRKVQLLLKLVQRKRDNRYKRRLLHLSLSKKMVICRTFPNNNISKSTRQGNRLCRNVGTTTNIFYTAYESASWHVGVLRVFAVASRRATLPIFAELEWEQHNNSSRSMVSCVYQVGCGLDVVK